MKRLNTSQPTGHGSSEEVKDITRYGCVRGAEVEDVMGRGSIEDIKYIIARTWKQLGGGAPPPIPLRYHIPVNTKAYI